MSGPSVHIAEFSNDVSTTHPFPVRSVVHEGRRTFRRQGTCPTGHRPVRAVASRARPRPDPSACDPRRRATRTTPSRSRLPRRPGPVGPGRDPWRTPASRSNAKRSSGSVCSLRRTRGKLIRDVDVGPRHEPIEHLAARRCGHIEGDAALVPVRHLEEVVDTVGLGRQAVADHRAHRIAFDPFDLDDVGAPVAERGRGRRDEAVLGEVDDLDAHERQCHRAFPSQPRSRGARCARREDVSHPPRAG